MLLYETYIHMEHTSSGSCQMNSTTQLNSIQFRVQEPQSYFDLHH